MNRRSGVERLGTEKIGTLLWEMSSQTTFSLLVYAIYSITDTYFLSVGINSLAAAVVYGTLVCGICLLIPAALVGLLSKESAIIAEGQTALRLLALSYPLTGVAMITAAAFQSVGRAKEALLLTLGGIILVKLPVLLLASHLFSLAGIWTAEACSELILCIVSFIVLKHLHPKPGGSA